MNREVLIFTIVLSFFCTTTVAASGPDLIWAGGGARMADESAPAYLAEAFVTLGQADTTYIFTEPVFLFKEGHMAMDLGLGLRTPVLSGQAVAGYNVYLDYTTDNHHERLGTGVEFFHPYFTSHLNVYLPFSDSHNREEALPGVDLTFGVPLPGISFISLWPGVYFYKGRVKNDMQGFSLAVQAKPMKVLTLTFGGRNDAIESGRYDRGEIFGKVEFTIPMSRMDDDLFKFDMGQYPVNVNNLLDHKVMREPFITIEKADRR